MGEGDVTLSLHIPRAVLGKWAVLEEWSQQNQVLRKQPSAPIVTTHTIQRYDDKSSQVQRSLLLGVFKQRLPRECKKGTKARKLDQDFSKTPVWFQDAPTLPHCPAAMISQKCPSSD